MSSSFSVVRRWICRSLGADDAGDSRSRGVVAVNEGEDEGEVSRLEGPGWFPRWATTSELELYKSEVAILGPIRPFITQKTIAGLNTIASLHEKRRGEGPASELVPFYSALPLNHQKTALKPIDADCYTSVVFVHGYAGGVANWLPVWKAFMERYDVYAIDLPGFARSVRYEGRPFNCPQDAINWYVGHFEHWFEAMKIGLELKDAHDKSAVRPPQRKIVLVGHSFGGYLCSQFAMRHPEIVDHLVLVDAWGVHRHIPPTPEEEAAKRAQQSYASQALNWAMDGIYWSKLLRSLGPAARSIFAKARPEFMDTWSPYLDDPAHFYEYTYHCNAQYPHTGERAFARIRCPKSGPFAARRPLYVYRNRFPRTITDSSTRQSPEPIAAVALSTTPTAGAGEAHVQGTAFVSPLITPNTVGAAVSSFAAHVPAAAAAAAKSKSASVVTDTLRQSVNAIHGAHNSTNGLSSHEDDLTNTTATATSASILLCTSPVSGGSEDDLMVPSAAIVSNAAPPSRERSKSAASYSEANPTRSLTEGYHREGGYVGVSSTANSPATRHQPAPTCCAEEDEDERDGGEGGQQNADVDAAGADADNEAEREAFLAKVFPPAESILPYPQHLPPRRNFKLTMLYGETSWLRSKDVEALPVLLKAEHGTDTSYHVISKAGHMVMVDNAPEFTSALIGRISEAERYDVL